MPQRLSLIRNLWAYALQKHFPLEMEMLSFIGMSILDYGLTYYLLMHSEAQVVEANPAALFFLNHWGLKGLLWFKMLMVAVILGICQLVSLERPIIARRVLNLGSTVVSGVVLYSLILAWFNQ